MNTYMVRIVFSRATKWAALSCLGFVLLMPQAIAQNAGSVESGLAMLAQQIVDKSVAADRKTIAVLPFPNADGTCSVLSTYLVDELILGLFSVPDSPVTIIERSQLEALISEMSIGEGGLLNPETTQKLGNISGVQGLTVGTITVIGDTVRVNARLVDTDTGRTISAAGVTLPRTSAVTQLLQQPLSRGVACGTNPGRMAPVATAGGAAGSMGLAVPVVAPGAQATYQAGNNVTIQITNILVASDGQYKVVGTATNTSEKDLSVMWLAPTSMLDQMGNVAVARSSTGILPCTYGGKWNKEHSWCDKDRNQKMEYTILTPGLPRIFAVTFQMLEGQKGLNSHASLTGRILIRGDKPEAYPINFPSLRLPTL